MAKNRYRPINLAEVSNTKEDIFTWDTLLVQAFKEKYGRRARFAYNPNTTADKKWFVRQLFDDVKNINPREPVEIRRNLVDVNEKVYSNFQGSGDDESTVKIVSSVENSEYHDYQVSTTRGVLWGTDANDGLLFGFPQTSNRVGVQSHHEESVKIPQGKKVVVKLMSYRVRYRLDYTLEFKIFKSARVRIKFDSCGCGLGLCKQMGNLTAPELLEPLPGFREDTHFVYFTQEGVLRWTANRMKVTKMMFDELCI